MKREPFTFEVAADAVLEGALAEGAPDVQAALGLGLSALLLAALRRERHATRHLVTAARLLGEMTNSQEPAARDGLLRVLKHALNEGAGRTAAPAAVAVH